MQRIVLGKNEKVDITVTACDEQNAGAAIVGDVDFACDSAGLTLTAATPACTLQAAEFGVHKVTCHALVTVAGVNVHVTEEIEVEVIPVHGTKLFVAVAAPVVIT